ncbi:MAG: glycosyltransferase, partial [Desulfobacula sp.]|nr:glycosyltransferase [Desulfobacula sp.]
QIFSTHLTKILNKYDKLVCMIKIIYTSVIDISKANGPGVNEREFVNILLKKYQEKCRIIIPQPENEVLELKGCLFVHYYDAKFFHKIFGRISEHYFFYKFVDKFLKNNECESLVTRISFLPIFFFLLHKRLKVPFFIKTMGRGNFRFSIRVNGLIKTLIGRILSIPNSYMIRQILYKAKSIDSCTINIASNIEQKFNGLKINVIPNATNTDRFVPVDKISARKEMGMSHFDKMIGYIGGVPSDRGAMTLVQILPFLKRKNASLGVLIVGDDAGMKNVKKTAKKLGVYEDCVFVGRVPYADVSKYIPLLDVGFAFNNAEKIKLVGNSNQKIRQYIACGVPVITSPGGSEFIEENMLGSVVNPDNLDEVIHCTDSWLKKTADKEFIKRARLYAVEKLSVSSTLIEREHFWFNLS